MPPPNLLTGYGLRIFDWDGTFISPDESIQIGDSPLELVVSIVNASSQDDKVGLLLFIDGEIASYSDDNKIKDANQMFKAALPQKSMINIPLTVNIKSMATMDRHSIYFVVIYNMDTNPLVDKNNMAYFTLPAKYNLVVNRKLAESVDTHSFSIIGVPLPDEYKDIVEGNALLTIIGSSSEEHSLFQKSKISVSLNEEVRLNIQSLAPPGKYYTYLFINHSQVKNTSFGDRLQWEIGDKQMLNYSFTLEGLELTGSLVCYTLTLPQDPDMNIGALKSQKFIIEVTK